MLKKPSFRTEKTFDNKRQAWIYQLKGKLAGSPECYAFLEDAREEVGESAPHVVLLMAGVTLINSTGIGMIAALLTSAGNQKGKLVLVDPSDSARRQLVVTHLWEYITVVETLNDLPEKLEG